MIQQFLQDWQKLIRYSKDTSNFDQKIFRIMSDKYAKAWARLPYDVQGEISFHIGALN